MYIYIYTYIHNIYIHTYIHKYIQIILIYIIYTQIDIIGHDCRTYAQVHELHRRHCSDNQEGRLFSQLRIYYVHLTSLGSEHSVCYEMCSISVSYI